MIFNSILGPIYKKGLKARKVQFKIKAQFLTIVAKGPEGSIYKKAGIEPN